MIILTHKYCLLKYWFILHIQSWSIWMKIRWLITLIKLSHLGDPLGRENTLKRQPFRSVKTQYMTMYTLWKRTNNTEQSLHVISSPFSRSLFYLNLIAHNWQFLELSANETRWINQTNTWGLAYTMHKRPGVQSMFDNKLTGGWPVLCYVNHRTSGNLCDIE